MKLLSLILVLVYSVACVTATSSPRITLLPTVTRADTREFIGFRFADSIVVNRIVEIILVMHPSEAAMCLYGYAQDTTYLTPMFMNPLDSVRTYVKIAIIDSVEAANIKQAGSTFVTYEDGVACDPNERLIALAHSHPTILRPINSCNHSDLDALFTHAKEQKYWFSLVFCPYSNSLMWADGRTATFGYGESKNNFDFESESDGVDNSLLDDYIKMMENMLNFN